MSFFSNILKNILLITISTLIVISICEMFLRLKHSIIPNYDIEMWKYSKKLKSKSENLKIGHVHVPNKKAILQKQEIRINNIGQRGERIDIEKIKNYERKIMFIGSSMLLGWGVEEEKILLLLLKKNH